VLRKEVHGDTQDLQATLFARHPRPARYRLNRRRSDLSAQIKLVHFSSAPKSKYLLTIPS
jgi:hypothetical protein